MHLKRELKVDYHDDDHYDEYRDASKKRIERPASLKLQGILYMVMHLKRELKATAIYLLAVAVASLG